ncbi:hypothetical protein RUND412_007268 [Rhizina undulata]
MSNPKEIDNESTNPSALTRCELGHYKRNSRALNPAAPEFITSWISNSRTSFRSDATPGSSVESLEENSSGKQTFPMASRQRLRPKLWNTQCKYTYAPMGTDVGDCRYGGLCLFRHEGDEYTDKPGVRQRFVNGRAVGADWEEGTVTFNPEGPKIITGMT